MNENGELALNETRMLLLEATTQEDLDKADRMVRFATAEALLHVAYELNEIRCLLKGNVDQNEGPFRVATNS